MHKYIIRITRYSEQGALTNERQYIRCDTPQELADKTKQYSEQKYSTTNEETGEITYGFKMFKVEPMQAVYQNIADWDAFCDMNAVLR